MIAHLDYIGVDDFGNIIHYSNWNAALSSCGTTS